MVVNTDTCVFSDWKIYPGRGVRFIDRDGRPFLFLSKRNRNFSLRKIKAQRLRWTTAWRTLNKKFKKADEGKVRRKKVVTIERAIEGVTLDAIRKFKTAKPEEKKAQAMEAIREIKERKKAVQAKKATEKKEQNKDKLAHQRNADKVAQKAQKKAAPKKK